MEFLDQLDVDGNIKKAHRVRSWYLYEQYKSLEHNQADAAQKLSNKTYQSKILHQELSERRARRNPLRPDASRSNITYRSESGIESIRSESLCMSVSSEDYLECYCDNVEDDAPPPSEDLNKPEDEKDHPSATSIPSVVQTYKSDLAVDIKEKLELVKNEIKDNLEKQREVLESTKDYYVDDKLSTGYVDDSDSLEYLDQKLKFTRRSDTDHNILGMWSRLVSFAYQVMRLNHGNCYYDYSSQFLTAVLACDVIWRGVTNLFGFLQPYVSPIKIPSSSRSTASVASRKTVVNLKRKPSSRKTSRKILMHKLSSNSQLVKRPNVHRTCSKKQANVMSEHCAAKKTNDENCQLHFYDDLETREYGDSYGRCKTLTYASKWPAGDQKLHLSEDECSDIDITSVGLTANPMLKLACYIDSLLDIPDKNL